MKLTNVFMTIAIAATVGFTSCKPKDADIQKNVQAKEAAGITVTVAEGVVTLTGDVADEAAKAKAAEVAKAEKGVKDVVNNTTVPAPVVVVPEPASVTTVLDAATQQKVTDGFKDIKGVTVTFNADKAVLTGAVTKADRMKVMQILSSAKVKSDVTGLTDKK